MQSTTSSTVRRRARPTATIVCFDDMAYETFRAAAARTHRNQSRDCPCTPALFARCRCVARYVSDTSIRNMINRDDFACRRTVSQQSGDLCSPGTGAQPVGLAALLRRLKTRGVHTVVYTGYTLEALARRPEPTVRVALEFTDLLIDGPYVEALVDGAGEWRGSRNQRLISQPAVALATLSTA